MHQICSISCIAGIQMRWKNDNLQIYDSCEATTVFGLLNVKKNKIKSKSYDFFNKEYWMPYLLVEPYNGLDRQILQGLKS